MINENIVRDLYVSDGNRTIKASYFVESGIIHANVEGRVLVLPVGGDGSEEGVRRLMIGRCICGIGASVWLRSGNGIGREAELQTQGPAGAYRALYAGFMVC